MNYITGVVTSVFEEGFKFLIGTVLWLFVNVGFWLLAFHDGVYAAAYILTIGLLMVYTDIVGAIFETFYPTGFTGKVSIGLGVVLGFLGSMFIL